MRARKTAWVVDRAARRLLQDLQMLTRDAVCELDTIERALRIFKPDLDLEEIMPRPVPPPHASFRGEVTRIVLDTLRKTTRPLTTHEVTLALMKERGLKTEDAKLVRVMQQRAVACLGHWKRRGYLKSSEGGQKGLQAWEIERQPVTDAS